MRVLSGVQPTGELHVGNYFGMIKPAIELQNQGGETFLFIADYHTLTTTPEPQDLRQRTRNVAIDFLACGLDPEKTVFFRQSDIPQVTELTWILCCLTPVGMLERCHSYKDKTAKGVTPNHGLLTYPALMAADILLYRADTVPVGKDQKQHVEVTRDIAQRFNNRYGDTFPLPEPRIKHDVAVVPGLDGQKMSKSYNNTIELFGNEKSTRKKFMKIVTDSKTVDQQKDPGSCNVFALYKLFAEQHQQEQLAKRYRDGGMGYGVAKQELFELFWEHFKPMRLRRGEILQDLAQVDDILKNGAEKARAAAEETMSIVRQRCGLR